MIYDLAARKNNYDPKWAAELEKEKKYLIKILREMRQVKKLIAVCFRK
jgi:hypothetical protein